MIAKKKSKKADLERKRFAFFQIGLVIAGAVCLAAFEYTGIRFSDLAENEKVEDIVPNYAIDQVIEFKELKQPKTSTTTKTEVLLEVKPVEKILDKSKQPKLNDKIKESDIVEFGDPEDGTGIVNTVPKDDSVHWVVSQMPEFPGGNAAMINWIGKNIDVPHYAEPLNGTVYVRFVVNTDGKISDVQLAKSLHSDYDKASLAVVSKMPKWSPGEQAGKKVNVRYDLPIKFVSH